MSNLTESTREFIDKTWRSAISYQIPLFTRLSERGQMVAGGIQYEQIVEIADSKSLVQTYGPNDPLDGGSQEIIDRPHWHACYMQIPVEESVDERVMNAPKGDAQLIGLRDKIAKNALKSLKWKMNDYLYGSAGDNTIDATHTNFQGLCSALSEDTTYGSLARTASNFAWWQAADEDNWDVAYAINKTNLDSWLDSVMEYADSPQDLLVIMGPTLWRRLKAQFEASNAYEPKGNMSAQGFESMTYNGVEIAKDFTLDNQTAAGVTDYTGTNVGLEPTGAKANGNTYVFVLDLSTWHLRYYQDEKSGPFEMTEFFSQDQLIGGVEKKLARIKWKGQLTCDAPNRNILRANVS